MVQPERGHAAAAWRKSSRSSGSGNCVEFATEGDVVWLRDSRDPETMLAFSADDWQTFLAGVKAGDFDPR